MKKIIVIILLFWGCEHGPEVIAWYGIPTPASCSWEDELGVCIAEGRTYTCIASDTDGCHNPSGTVSCALATASATRTLIERRKTRHAQDDEDATNAVIMGGATANED